MAASPRVQPHWDSNRRCWVAPVGPGEFCVSSEDTLLLTTLLGSCVTACIYDVQAGIGGMNHFLLPLAVGERGYRSPATRYGAYAMEVLVNELLKHGALRRNLRAKVFGGASLLEHRASVGAMNVEFVTRYLFDEGIPLTSWDTGGELPRKLEFFPRTGRVRLKKLRRDGTGLGRREAEYLASLERKPPSGDVELF
ncbi:MAG: chemoreceptor glutamine deamidase CheD [Armatimonadetes bacterium]|nr:chemoreceptor glutamine deamidase CheD [Armatimonadota bacterium]